MHRKHLTILMLAIGLLAAGSASAQTVISAQLERQLAQTRPNELLPVNVILQAQAAPEVLEAITTGLDRWQRRTVVVDYLREFAQTSQQPLLDYLSAQQTLGNVREIKPLWISNVITAEIRADRIASLPALFPQIQNLDWDRPYEPEELLDDLGSSLQPKIPTNTDDIAYGVQAIGAPAAWALGYTGQGVVIGNLDTGCNYNHTDLASRIWVNPEEDLNGNGVVDASDFDGIDNDDNGYVDDLRGWNFSNNNNDVMDGGTHGTSTSGILVGDGTAGTQTGVAPGAKLMTLKNNGGGASAYWQAQQYAVLMGVDVVQSSLSYKWPESPNYAVFRQNCVSELAAGIVHTNSIGNQGNQQGTYPIPFNISAPGLSPSAWLGPYQRLVGGLSSIIAVGAYDAAGNIKDYSGRGPSAWNLADILALNPGYPYAGSWPVEYNDYPYAQGGLIKPDISAPTDVTTTYRYGGYTSGFNGTSAAAPHGGGACALLLSAVPSLTPAEISMCLQLTAQDADIVGKDNVFGAGRLNVASAVNLALQGFAPQSVTVTLTPQGAPIVIPGAGGNFSFDISIQSNAASALTLMVWTTITLPNTHTYGPIVVRLINIAPGATINRTLGQYIPGSAPSGSYSYNAYIGFYGHTTWDSDSFNFSKSTDGGDAGVAGWSASDWEQNSTLEAPLAVNYDLVRAYPNPFNPTTTLSYQLSAFSYVSLKVYDTAGRLVATLVEGQRAAGAHSAIFDGADLPSGIYVYQLKAGEQVASGKMLLIK